MSGPCKQELLPADRGQTDLHQEQASRGRCLCVPSLHGNRGSPQEGINLTADKKESETDVSRYLCREDIHLFDTTNHKQNAQVMINMATMYTVKDAVEVISNKMISRTTVLHHTCVLIAYCHVLTVLHGDFNVEGIFKVKIRMKILLIGNICFNT